MEVLNTTISVWLAIGGVNIDKAGILMCLEHSFLSSALTHYSVLLQGIAADTPGVMPPTAVSLVSLLEAHVKETVSHMMLRKLALATCIRYDHLWTMC